MSVVDLPEWDFDVCPSRHYSLVGGTERNPAALGGEQRRYTRISQVSSQDLVDLATSFDKLTEKEQFHDDMNDPFSLTAADSHEDGAEGLPRERSRRSIFTLNAVEDYDRCKKVFERMKYLTCIAAIGGFLSGYNTGVISGALLPLTRVFHLSSLQEESIVSATIFFAFCSSMVGGWVNQVCGRRRTILAAAAIFTCGGIFLFGAQNYPMLVVGEAILGIGIGLESLTNPMYISEVSKPELRGMLVSAYAWMMCFGQFFAGIVDGVAGPFKSGWRFMFGMAALPGTLMFVGFLTLPESPAWLMSIGQEKQAKEILKRFRDKDQDADSECEDIKDSLRISSKDQEESSIWQLFQSPSLRRALIVGCSLMLLQQFCGANVVMYYSASVYRMSGFGEVTAIWLSAFTALAQLVGLALSLNMVETAGRRPLVLFSLTGVSICLLGLGISFYLARLYSEEIDPLISDPECLQRPALIWDGVSKNCYDCTMIEGCGFVDGACVKGDVNGPFEAVSGVSPDNSDWHLTECDVPEPIGWMPVGFMVLYLIAFGVGLGGLPWTINSEIYPIKHRSLAVGISTGANWICNLVISSTFLTISDPGVLTLYGSFWMYAIISLCGVVWLYFMLPETKGLSYEQIERCFDHEAAPDTTTSTEKDRLLLAMDSTSSGGYGSTANDV